MVRTYSGKGMVLLALSITLLKCIEGTALTGIVSSTLDMDATTISAASEFQYNFFT